MSCPVSSETFLDSVAFEKLKKVMHDGTNINFECYRESYLKRRIKVRLSATKTHTYSNYMQYLKTNPNEYDLLINDLTINYTKFFRDSDVYVFLKQTLFPELVASKSWIRIWSAGCSTGEEPYSLAMLAHEVLKQTKSNSRITIYASDLDKNSLAKARNGEYTSRMIQGIEEEIINKYFEHDNDTYTIKKSVKQLVHFEEQDLMTPPRHQNLDLILCRNVMIYFSRQIQQKIHMNFYEALRCGGYLITGKTEMLGAEVHKKFADYNAICRIYQKA